MPGVKVKVPRSAAERQSHVMQLRMRGLSFEAISKQIDCSPQAASKLFRRALERIPKADVNSFRSIETLRLADLRRRLYAELNSRPDPRFPGDPTKVVLPSIRRELRLIDSLVKIGQHEAQLFGMRAPKKSKRILEHIQKSSSDEEWSRQWDRLTIDEQIEFSRILDKMEGKDAEPHAYNSDTNGVNTVSEASGAEIIRSEEDEDRKPDEFGLDNGTRRRDAPAGSEMFEVSKTSNKKLGQESPPYKTKSSSAVLNESAFNDSYFTTVSSNSSKTSKFQPCPKCGRHPNNSEGPIYNNGIPIWHTNCHPTSPLTSSLTDLNRPRR
jgi:hypothetical protein